MAGNLQIFVKSEAILFIVMKMTLVLFVYDLNSCHIKLKFVNIKLFCGNIGFVNSL